MLRWLSGLLALTLGLAAVALLSNTLGVQRLAAPDPQSMTPRGVNLAELEERAAPEPQPAEPDEIDEAADPLLDYVLAEANRLPDRFLDAADLEPIVADWKSHASFESHFAYQGDEQRRFVTVTSVRVDCRRVDRSLQKHGDSRIGRADRCARWRQKARETMRRYGIEDLEPDAFLEKIGSQATVRTMLVYAGWYRDPELNDALRLLASQSVPVYPQEQFGTRDFAARDLINREMKLGPYAEDRAVAWID